MPRDLLIGNGSLVVAFDPQYRLADVFYPHVGLENHAGAPFRLRHMGGRLVQLDRK